MIRFAFTTLSLNLMQLFEFHFSSALSRKIPALALTLCDSNQLHLQSTRGHFSTESRKTKTKDITATKVNCPKRGKTRVTKSRNLQLTEGDGGASFFSD